MKEMKEATPAADWTADAVEAFELPDGKVIHIRSLGMTDLYDIPDSWVSFGLMDDDDPLLSTEELESLEPDEIAELQKERTKELTPEKRAEMARRSIRAATDTVIRGTVSPRFFDPDADGVAPEGGVPIWTLGIKGTFAAFVAINRKSRGATDAKAEELTQKGRRFPGKDASPAEPLGTGKGAGGNGK